MIRYICLFTFLSSLAMLPAQATTSTQRAVLSALASGERSHSKNTDIEGPKCVVVQVWAQCHFLSGHGNSSVRAWLHEKNGRWTFLGDGGGVTFASDLESQYGIPAAIANQFAHMQY